jgi:hypothetical protein
MRSLRWKHFRQNQSYICCRTNKAGPLNVYTTDITPDETNEALYDAHSTEVYHVDTYILDIVVHETDTRPKSNSLFLLPREEWLKFSQENRDELIAKRRKERALQYGLNQRNSPAARRVNYHFVQDVVNLDDIGDCVILPTYFHCIYSEQHIAQVYLVV